MLLLNHTIESHARCFCITYTSHMEQPKNKGGRPKKPAAELLVQRSIRFSPEMWAKIDANGIEWLRCTVPRYLQLAGCVPR